MLQNRAPKDLHTDEGGDSKEGWVSRSFALGLQSSLGFAYQTRFVPGGGSMEKRVSGMGSLIWMFVNCIVVVATSVFVPVW